jgi:hypothetical protein
MSQSVENTKLLGRDVIQFNRSLPMFRRNVLPPSSGSKSKLFKQAEWLLQNSSRCEES